MVEQLTQNLKAIRAPWVFAVVLLTTAVATLLVVNGNLAVPEAAYGFAVLLIGGFLTKALLAVKIGALRTMFLMFSCALWLIVINVGFTDAAVFKDSAVAGLLNFAGGSTIVLIAALFERLKED